jgi:hypothetical protein
MNAQTHSAYFASKAIAELALSHTARSRRVRDSHLRIAASCVAFSNDLKALDHSAEQFALDLVGEHVAPVR